MAIFLLNPAARPICTYFPIKVEVVLMHPQLFSLFRPGATLFLRGFLIFYKKYVIILKKAKIPKGNKIKIFVWPTLRFRPSLYSFGLFL
jgi:hypothetical protein